ncbi:MAG: Na-K-Cl cotransporter [Candidatus Omnitrophica bacterium]|nr:Na-K-Cl cotransporter [Candidatus Omnitrophota bacterium]
MSNKRFTTFEGVFTPSLLSILGVIMYLRLGWVVGNVGFLGASIIIILSNFITLMTALSMSSVVTNIRIGAGGAYSIITKSLGVEAGGAIGLPLYLSQAISVAFYIAGFAEGWGFLFPGHSALLVALVTWFVLLAITYMSAKLAFRIQYAIMVLIVLSLVSIFLGQGYGEPKMISVLQLKEMANFWTVFAVFFPAVTGILAGASMSGELIDPKRSIPKGTLWAMGICFLIYMLLAYWMAKQFSADVLKENNYAMIEVGRWGILVILGIMGATLSSALNMFVGAPRVLAALGKHGILPGISVFTRHSDRNEPVTAILMTSLIALATILFGSLDQIAGLLTMFFLITYGMINLIVFFEQSMGIVSFRPTFKVSRWVSFLGSLGCVFVMFLINSKFSLLAIFVIVIMYLTLIRREVEVYSPNIRSGLLLFFAEELTKMASRLPYFPKIWKPNLFVSIQDSQDLKGVIQFLYDMTAPSGRIFVSQVIPGKNQQKLSRDSILRIKSQLDSDLEPLTSQNVFIESSVLSNEEGLNSQGLILKVLKSMHFPPNTLFVPMNDNRRDFDAVHRLLSVASEEDFGIIVLKLHEQKLFGERTVVNLWIRKNSPNIDLSVLIALQLERNWDAKIRIIQVVEGEDEIKESRDYIKRMCVVLRMPLDVEIKVIVGDFNTILKTAPAADINIFGMQQAPEIRTVMDVADRIQTTVLFLRDSTHESALA